MHVAYLPRSLAHFIENRLYKLDLNKHEKPNLDVYLSTIPSKSVRQRISQKCV